MFVRLFVDENLDRMVPISKQPKDKIQAILDACDRQFPEFHERSRKRIRTYLKSCRRMRRSKEQNGWESVSTERQVPINPEVHQTESEETWGHTNLVKFIDGWAGKGEGKKYHSWGGEVQMSKPVRVCILQTATQLFLVVSGGQQS